MDLGIARTVGVKEIARHGIRVADGTTALRALERTPGEVALLSVRGASATLTIDTVSAYPDHAVFAFVTAESLQSRAQGDPWRQTESGTVFSTLGIARELRFDGAWSLTVAFVPREAIAAQVPSTASDFQAFPERRLLDRAMRGFVDGLLCADERATTIERYALDQLITEMGRAILLDRSDASDGASPHAELREKAITLIAQQCGDPNLTSARVAHELQASLRQLQLVFAEADTGISVSGEIRRQRARLARSLLVDARFERLTVAQIAKRSGFRSPMSMRRALDAAYHASPGAIRAQHRARS